MLARSPKQGGTRNPYLSQYDTCACGAQKRASSKRCSNCSGVGRPIGNVTAAVIKYGIDKQVARNLGGVARLDKLPEDIRNLLLKGYRRPAGSPPLRQGGLATRKMAPLKRGLDTQGGI